MLFLKPAHFLFEIHVGVRDVARVRLDARQARLHAAIVVLAVTEPARDPPGGTLDIIVITEIYEQYIHC